MATLETTFAGLKLRNPIIISSSGLTDSAAKNQKLYEAGAGAIVLKSLFEEQIMMEADWLGDPNMYPEGSDYLVGYIREHKLGEYLNLIKESKKVCDIPIIASINCYQDADWIGNQRCAVHKTALLGTQLFAVQNQLAEIPQELAFQLDRITFVAVIFGNIHRIDMRFARCRDFNHFTAKSLDQPRIFIFRVDDDQIVLRPAQHDTCHHLHNSKGFAEAGHAQHHTSRGRQQFSVDHNQIFTAGVGALIQSTGLE